MPFIYAFNIREMVSPALNEMRQTNPAYNALDPYDLVRWWLTVAIERIYLLEFTGDDYPHSVVYPYVDFTYLDKLVGDMTIYTTLVNIIRTHGFGRFDININHNYDGFLILDK